jgi:hypothetical protein
MRMATIKKTVRPGDAVKCMGVTAIIDEILYQDYDYVDGWDIEFVDDMGNYRHWKQYFDGGDVEFKSAGSR